MIQSYNLPPFTVDQARQETINWGLTCEGIPDLWKTTKGRNVKVAILDSGIAQRHQDLADAILSATDFTHSNVEDKLGHGTFCAGVIGARENRFGVVGVAPECQLLIAKVVADNKSCTDEAIVRGLEWSISQGADIISMSIGSKHQNEEVHDAIKAAAKHSYIICAAGNNGPTLDSVNYPARYDETISVGAIDRNRHVPNYSSRGIRVDIVAPGDQVISCWPPNGMAMLSGTSTACPFVAGVVALIIADRVNDNRMRLTKEQIVDTLAKSSLDIDQTGKDRISGFGLIDSAALLRESEEHYPK